MPDPRKPETVAHPPLVFRFRSVAGVIAGESSMTAPEGYLHATHGLYCAGCGVSVVDPKQHDVWHRMLDALTAGVGSASESTEGYRSQGLGGSSPPAVGSAATGTDRESGLGEVAPPQPLLPSAAEWKFCGKCVCDMPPGHSHDDASALPQGHRSPFELTERDQWAYERGFEAGMLSERRRATDSAVTADRLAEALRAEHRRWVEDTMNGNETAVNAHYALPGCPYCTLLAAYDKASDARP